MRDIINPIDSNRSSNFIKCKVTCFWGKTPKRKPTASSFWPPPCPPCGACTNTHDHPRHNRSTAQQSQRSAKTTPWNFQRSMPRPNQNHSFATPRTKWAIGSLFNVKTICEISDLWHLWNRCNYWSFCWKRFGSSGSKLRTNNTAKTWAPKWIRTWYHWCIVKWIRRNEKIENENGIVLKNYNSESKMCTCSQEIQKHRNERKHTSFLFSSQGDDLWNTRCHHHGHLKRIDRAPFDKK